MSAPFLFRLIAVDRRLFIPLQLPPQLGGLGKLGTILGAQGLRMSGRNNVVRGNFVSGCGYGIRVACGEFIASALTPSYVPDVKPNGRKTADVRIPTYPQVQKLTLSDNVMVGISGPDLEVGSSYKNHWPESQALIG